MFSMAKIHKQPAACFCNGCVKIQTRIIQPVFFNEGLIFPKALRPFLKKLHGYNRQYAV